MASDTPTPKLVVTLGPQSIGLEADLIAAGAEAFRLNASHLDLSGLARALENAKRAAPHARVIVDLQGAKMRLGVFEPRQLRPEETLAVVLGDSAVGDAVPLPHPEAFAALGVGDAISLDDGRLRARVARTSPELLELVVSEGGLLKPRKGFNRAEHPIQLRQLTANDAALARCALAAGCRDFAFSFTSDGRECAWVRSLGSGLRVAAKIERSEALANISAIAELADTLWICRGDLGAQVGEFELGRHVATIEPTRLPCPVLMAGQVLEHLTDHSSPTRSELCHITDLGARGYAGIVLSDETAIGSDPVRATRWAAQLVSRAFH